MNCAPKKNEKTKENKENFEFKDTVKKFRSGAKTLKIQKKSVITTSKKN